MRCKKSVLRDPEQAGVKRRDNAVLGIDTARINALPIAGLCPSGTVEQWWPWAGPKPGIPSTEPDFESRLCRGPAQIAGGPSIACRIPLTGNESITICCDSAERWRRTGDATLA